MAFLGARTPLRPLEVKLKVKVKAKKFRNNMLLLELLDDLQYLLGTFRHY